MSLLEKYLKQFEPYLKENNISLKIIGQKYRLPRLLNDFITLLERNTNYQNFNNHKNNDLNDDNIRFKKKEKVLCLAISYGGRDDIVSACKEVAELVNKKQLRVNDINEELFAK